MHTYIHTNFTYIYIYIYKSSKFKGAIIIVSDIPWVKM